MSLVSIQITHHENINQKYLDQVIASIQNQSYKNYEVILIDSTLNGATVPPWVKHHRIPRETLGPAAQNMGARFASKDAKYFLWTNDDVIFSKDSITEMVSFAGDHDCMVNPVSNCENGMFYLAAFDIQNAKGDYLPVKQFMRYEETIGFVDSIMNYPRGSRLALMMNYLCMFATLIPKKTFDLIGGYDENYIGSWADTDFSFQLRDKGINRYSLVSSFVWHYGGVTTTDNMKIEKRNKDRTYFSNKWKIPFESLF